MAEKKDKKTLEISKELRAQLKKEAFADACAQLGTTPEKLDAIAKAKKELEIADGQMVEFTIPFQVSVNGIKYLPGIKHRLPYRQANPIMNAAGKKRYRLILEKVSSKHEIQQLAGGQIVSRLVSQTDEAGLEVSKI